MRRLASGSLRVRLMLPIAVGVITSIAVLGYSSVMWRRLQLSDAADDARQFAQAIAAVHARNMDDARRTLEAAAAAGVQGAALPTGLDAALRPAPQYGNVGVCDDAGRVLWSHDPVAAEVASHLPDLAGRARGSRGSIVDAYALRPATRSASVVLARSLADEGLEGRTLFGVVDPRWLRDAIDARPVRTDTTITIYDPAGGRVLMRGPDGAASGQAALDPLVPAMFAGAAAGVVRSASPDGVVRIAAHARADDAGGGPLVVMVAMPEASAFTPQNPLLVRLSVGLLLALGLAGLLAWVSASRLTGAMDRLVATTQRGAANGIDASAAIAGGTPELRHLAAAIDGMAVALAAREHEILHRHDTLMRRDRQLRAVIESAIDGVVLFDRDGTVLYASPSGIYSHAYHVDELVGRRPFEFVHPDDRAALRAGFDRVSRAPGASFSATFRLQTADASWRWIHAEVGNQLQDPRVQALVGKYRDVTELHDLETARRRAHADLEQRVAERTAELTDANRELHKLSRGIEQTADSVFITDRTGVIDYVNPAFEEMTGYARQEAIGNSPRMFSSGLHDRKFYDHLWDTILAGKVFRAIVTNRRKDGRLFSEDQTITPIRDATGAITHFVSTGRDITDRKRTEAALRRLNAALEDESSRIAAVLHDEAGQFLSSAHIHLADLARDLTPEQRSRVQQVRQHLDRAEEQLRRVSHELHPRILDDLGLCEAVRFLAHGFGRRNGILVDVDVTRAPSCPRPVETVLYRLVQEGLTNIGKHAHAARAWVELSTDGPSLYCSIRDDGIGFDAGNGIEERDGFSLGLTLMRDRLEAVGGRLTIRSVPEHGTELRATIPMES